MWRTRKVKDISHRPAERRWRLMKDAFQGPWLPLFLIRDQVTRSSKPYITKCHWCWEGENHALTLNAQPTVTEWRNLRLQGWIRRMLHLLRDSGRVTVWSEVFVYHRPVERFFSRLVVRWSWSRAEGMCHQCPLTLATCGWAPCARRWTLRFTRMILFKAHMWPKGEGHAIITIFT